MLHLSALSEHAVGALTAAGAGRAARASRQVAPAYAAAESGLCAAGVSAFAFQGTNAHVQLTLPSHLLQDSGSRGRSTAGEQGVGGAVVWSVSERLWVTHVASPLLRGFLCPDGARAQAAMEQLALPHFSQHLSPHAPPVMFELRLGAPHLAPLAGLCVGGMGSDSGMQGFDASSESLHLVPPSLMLAMAAAAVRSADLRQPRCQSPVLLCDGEFAPQAPEPTGSYLAASLLCVLSPADGRVVVLAASDEMGAGGSLVEQSSEWEAAQVQQDGEDGKVWQGDGGFDDDVQGEGVDQEEQQAWEAEQPDEGWEQEQAEAGVQLLLSASIVATLPVQHSTAVAAVESSLEGPAVARARQIVRSLMHELGAFGDLVTAAQQEAPMFATLGSPGSGGSCGMDEGVAEVCLEEARLQLRGAGLLSGFDSWVLGAVV